MVVKDLSAKLKPNVIVRGPQCDHHKCANLLWDML
jgi:hypothetical protein